MKVGGRVGVLSQRAWPAWARRIVAAVCIPLAAQLVLVGVAVAGRADTAKSESWQIGVNDALKPVKVRAGGRFKVCAKQSVGSIGAKVVLHGPIPAGATIAYVLDGPRSAGDALTTTEPSDGKGTAFDADFIPLTFPRLKARDASGFPLGTYRFALTAGGRKVADFAVTLARGPACVPAA